MTDDQKLLMVQAKTEKYRHEFCSTKFSYRLWRDPKDGKIWMPCIKHIDDYAYSNWKEIKLDD